MQVNHEDWAEFSFQASNVTSNDDDFGEFGGANFVGGSEPNQNGFGTNDWSGFSSGTSITQTPTDNLQQQPQITPLNDLDGFANESIPTATALPVEEPTSPKVNVPRINLEPLPNLTELQLTTGLNSLQLSENNSHPAQVSPTETADTLMNDFVLIPKSPISSYPTSPQLSPRTSTNIPVPETNNDAFQFDFGAPAPSITPSMFESSEFPVTSNSPETSREEIEFTFDTNVNNMNNLDSQINDSGSILNETATTQDMLISDSLDTSTQSSPSEIHVVPLTPEPEQPSDVKSLVVQQISLLKENDKTLNVSVEVNMEEANPLISVSEKERESAEEEQRKKVPSVHDQPELEFDWKAPTFSPGELNLVSLRGRSKTNLRDSLEKKAPLEHSPSEDDIAASPALSPRKEEKFTHSEPSRSETPFENYPSPLLSPVKRESDLDSVAFDDDSSAVNEEWGNFEQPQLKQSQEDGFPTHPEKQHHDDLFPSTTSPQQDEDNFFQSKAQEDEDIFPSSKPQEDEDIFPSSKAQDEDIFPVATSQTEFQATTSDDFDDFGGFETANANNDADDFGNFADSGSTFDADFDVPSTPAPVVSHPAPSVTQPSPVSQAPNASQPKSFFTKSADEIRSTVDQTLVSLNAGQLRITNDVPKEVKLLEDIIAENAMVNPLPFATKLDQAAKMELTPKQYLQSVGEGGESRRYLSPLTLPAMYGSFIESLDIKIIPPEEEIEDAESGLLKPQPVSLSAVTPGTPPRSPLLNRATKTEAKAPADVFTTFGELGINFDQKPTSQPTSNQNSRANSPVVTPRAQSSPSTPRAQVAPVPKPQPPVPVVELNDFSSFDAFSAPATAPAPAQAPTMSTPTAPVQVPPTKPVVQGTFTSEPTSWNSASEANTFEVNDFGFSEFTAASTKPTPPPQPSTNFEANWGSYAGPVTATVSAIPSESQPSPREATPQGSQDTITDEFSSFTATSTHTDDDFSAWSDFGAPSSTASTIPDLSSFTASASTPTAVTTEPVATQNTLPMTSRPTEFEVMNPELLPATQISPAKHSIPEMPTASLSSQFSDFSSLGSTPQFGSDNTFSTDFTSSSFAVGTDFGATSGLAPTAQATTTFSTTSDFGSFGNDTTPTPAFGSTTSSFGTDTGFSSFTTAAPTATVSTTSDFGSFENASVTPAFTSDFNSFGSSPPSTSVLTTDFTSSFGTSPPTSATLNTDFTSFGTNLRGSLSSSPVAVNVELAPSFGTSPPASATLNTDFTSFGGSLSTSPVTVDTDFSTFITSTNAPTTSSYGGSLTINTSSTSSDLFREIGSGQPTQPSPTVTVVAAPEFDDDFGSFVDSSQTGSTFDFDHPVNHVTLQQSYVKPISDSDFLGANSTPSIPTLVAIPTTAPMPTGPSAVLAVGPMSGTTFVGSPRSSVDIPPLALNRLASPTQTPKVLSPVHTPKVMSPSQTPKTLSPRSSIDFHPTASFSSQPLDGLNFGASFSSTDSFSRSKPQSPRSSMDLNPSMSRSMPSIDINPMKPTSPTSSIDFSSLGGMKSMSTPVSPRSSVDVHPIGFINPGMSKSMDTNLLGKQMSPRSSLDTTPMGLMNPTTPRGMSPRSSIDLHPGNLNHSFMNPIQQVEIPTAVPVSAMPTVTSIPTTIPSLIPTSTTSIPTTQAFIPTAIPTAVAAPSSSSFDDFADFQDASSSSFQFEADFDITPAKPAVPTATFQAAPVLASKTSTSPPSSSMMFPQIPIQPATPLIPMTLPQQPQQAQKSNASSLLRSSMDILSQPQQNLGWGAAPVQPTGVPSYMGAYNPAQPQIQAIRPNTTGGSYNTTPTMMPGYGITTQQPAIQSQPTTFPLQAIPNQPSMSLHPQQPMLNDYSKSAIPPEQDRAFLGWIGSLSRPESESRLAMVGDGTYLVRWAESHSTYVISCKLNGVVQHLNVLRNVDGRVAVTTTNEVFSNIKECVQSFRGRGFINKPIAI